MRFLLINQDQQIVFDFEVLEKDRISVLYKSKKLELLATVDGFKFNPTELEDILSKHSEKPLKEGR